MNPLEQNVNFEWRKFPSDMSVCSTCNETIFGNMYKNIMELNGEHYEVKPYTVLCESCFMELKTEE